MPRKSIINAAEALHRIVFAEPSAAKFASSTMDVNMSRSVPGHETARRQGVDSRQFLQTLLTSDTPTVQAALYDDSS